VIINNSLRKVDLHIHTPVSTCYSEKSASPERIVDAALAVGLEAIAVTDHNTCEGIENISHAGAEKGLVVFPGVELSTKEGHFVSIFDTKISIASLKALLDTVGITKEAAGDGHALAQADIESILKTIHKAGGIIIAAHIDRWPSGFIETKQSRRVKEMIHASNFLDALEITIPQNKGLWNDGLVHGYPRKSACIQSSDAHSTSEIGRRTVYIEMEQVGISGLRLAFLDYRNKVVFPQG
jgi:PHP family Zn ribbon phosphoesterase